jgi:hypothetical protein
MTGRAGKKRNIWLVWLVWPLITLGIYYFVWWYKINREARDFDEKIAVEPALSVLAVTVGWLIIVPPYVSVFRTGERIGQMQEDAGMERTCNGWIGLVLSFFASLNSLYYQYELNRIWDRLGSPEEGSLVALPVGGALPTGTPAAARPGDGAAQAASYRDNSTGQAASHLDNGTGQAASHPDNGVRQAAARPDNGADQAGPEQASSGPASAGRPTGSDPGATPN